MTTTRFLSDEWLDRANKLRAELGGGASIFGDARLNLVATDGPEGVRSLHLAGGDFVAGLIDDAPATLTIDFEVARALLVEGDAGAAMSAFQSGKIKIEGDITALMALAGGGAGDTAAAETYQRELRAITLIERPSTTFGPMSDELLKLGLQPYAEELAEKGLTIVPPEVHGVTEAQIDHLAAVALRQAEELTGCAYSLKDGPLGELDYSNVEGAYGVLAKQTNQFLVHRLPLLDRAFRDLAVNPVQTALIRHMMGDGARFSSFNCFVKWPGDFGYGPNLGLHIDQGQVPGASTEAWNANATWNLTEYTKDDGCLAYVPGSHLRATPSDKAEDAVPVECVKGSLIVFHGATYHGAYPKKTPGLRLTVANYFRHAAICSQEEIVNTFPRDLAADCDNPDLFAALAGFSDMFPYREQTASHSPTPIPQLARA